MQYQKIDLIQGTPEWREERMNYVTASQVPALFNISPYQTASDVLKEKYTGIEPEVDAFKQVLFKKGHDVEALAREWVKKSMSLNAEPAVVVSTVCPDLLASLDGFDEAANIIFEAKYMGKKSLEAMDTGIIKPHHLAQVQAQLLASGAQKCVYFAVDDSGNAKMAEIYPDTHFFERIKIKIAEFMMDLRALRDKKSELENHYQTLNVKYQKPRKARKSA